MKPLEKMSMEELTGLPQEARDLNYHLGSAVLVLGVYFATTAYLFQEPKYILPAVISGGIGLLTRLPDQQQ